MRRAYTDLQSNYILYQKDAEMIRRASDDVIKMKNNEVVFWQKAYEQESVWYKSVWFGVAVGAVITGGAVILAGQL